MLSLFLIIIDFISIEIGPLVSILSNLRSSVTFSRIDPGGKLVMGFRKTSNIPTDQVYSLRDAICLI